MIDRDRGLFDMDAQFVDAVVDNAWPWWIAVAVATLAQLMLLIVVWRLRGAGSGVLCFLPADRHRRPERRPERRAASRSD